MTKHTDLKGERRHTDPNDRKKFRVVGVRHVPTPDAESRIARAISTLLTAAARHIDLSEENAKPEKENNLTKDSAGGPD